MGTKQPLLSICIPTYNRANVLKDCLNSIVDNKAFDANIEVIVSDNHSTDSTESIVKSFTEKHPNIKYFKQNYNIGANGQNILYTLEQGTGIFLKISNDYSLFKENSLSFMLNVIKQHKQNKPILYFHNHVGKGISYTTSSFDEFLCQEKIGLGWIGNYGFWKEDLKKIVNKEGYFYTLFPHLNWFIQSFFMKKKIFCYNEPLFTNKNLRSKTGTYNFIDAHAKKFFIPLNELYEKRLVSSKSIEETKKQSLYFCTWVMIRRIFGDKRQCRFSTENGWNIIKKEFGEFSWYKRILLKGIILALIAMPYERAKSFICNFLQK